MIFYSSEFDRDIYINKKNNIHRLSLKICNITSKITINSPVYISNSEIYIFFIENSGWIKEQLKHCVVTEIVQEGSFLPIEGNHREVILSKKITNISLCDPKKIFLPSVYKNVGLELKNFLIGHSKKMMIPILKQKANLIQKKISKISFKDTKSRWGSCTSNRSIMINWRLIMAPPSVYKYVLIHELSHLVHMNHSSKFWKLVWELHPNYLNDKKWLKIYGKEIRKYVFN